MTARDTIDRHAALRKLEDWKEKTPGAKQRRFKRFAARGQIRLLPGEVGANWQDSYTVHVRDASRGGIGILSNQEVSRGRFWQVQIASDRLAIATRPGFCRYCREVTPGAYLIGIELCTEASILLSLGVSARFRPKRARLCQSGYSRLW